MKSREKYLAILLFSVLILLICGIYSFSSLNEVDAPYKSPKLYIDMPYEEIIKLQDKKLDFLGCSECMKNVSVHVRYKDIKTGKKYKIFSEIKPDTDVFYHFADKDFKELPSDKWQMGLVAAHNDIFGMKQLALYPLKHEKLVSDFYFSMLLSSFGVASSSYVFPKVRFNGEEIGVMAQKELLSEDALKKKGAFCLATVLLKDVQAREIILSNRAFFKDFFWKWELENLPSYDFGRFIYELKRHVRSRKKLSLLFDMKKVKSFMSLASIWYETEDIDLERTRFCLNSNTGKLEPIWYKPLGSKSIVGIRNKNSRINQICKDENCFSEKEKIKSLLKGVFSNQEKYEDYVEKTFPEFVPEQMPDLKKVLIEKLD